MNIYLEAQQDDFISVFELIKVELGYTELDFEQAMKRLGFFASSKNWCTYVAVRDDKVLGFVGITKGIAYNIESEYAQIMALAVSEKYRHKGIGTLLLKQAENWALMNGIKNIGVNSGLHRPEAHQFYEHNGYCKKSFSFGKILECEHSFFG